MIWRKTNPLGTAGIYPCVFNKVKLVTPQVEKGEHSWQRKLFELCKHSSLTSSGDSTEIYPRTFTIQYEDGIINSQGYTPIPQEEAMR